MTKKQNTEVAGEIDIFADDSAIPQSNWFAFTTVGDFIQGTLVDVFDNEGKFGAQKVYVVETIASSSTDLSVGTQVNVGLKITSNKYNIQQLHSAAIGDVVGFKYKADVDTGKGHPAKSLEIRIRRTVKKEKEDGDVPF